MSLIPILTSNEFGSFFYAMAAILILSTIWVGYAHTRFNAPWAYTLMSVVIAFTVFYLGYRFGTGYTEGKIREHAETDTLYVFWAALHGSISLIAILLMSYLFHAAHRDFSLGKNYFREHKKMTSVVVFLWLFLLISFALV